MSERKYYQRGFSHMTRRDRYWQEEEAGDDQYRLSRGGHSSSPGFSHGGSDRGGHSSGPGYLHWGSDHRFSHGTSGRRSSHGGHISSRRSSHGGHISSRRFAHEDNGSHSSSVLHTPSHRLGHEDHGGHASSVSHTKSSYGRHHAGSVPRSSVPKSPRGGTRFAHGVRNPVPGSSLGGCSSHPKPTQSRVSHKISHGGQGGYSPVPKSPPVEHRSPPHWDHHPGHRTPSHGGHYPGRKSPSHGNHHLGHRSPSHGDHHMSHRSPSHGGRHHMSPLHGDHHLGHRSPSHGDHHLGHRSPLRDRIHRSPSREDHHPGHRSPLSHHLGHRPPSHEGRHPGHRSPLSHHLGHRPPSHEGHHPGHKSPSHGGHHMRQRHSGPVRYISREDLRKLAQSSPAEIVSCVNENEAGFLAAYSHDKYCKDDFAMKHLIKLLHLLTKAEDFERIASRILARILGADGSYALFMMKLDILIKKMIDEGRSQIRSENPLYLDYLVDIGSKAIEVIPATVLITYPLPVIKKTVEDLNKRGEISDALYHKAKSLEEAFELAREERLKPDLAMDIDGSDQMPPPELFTNVEVLPSLEEVHSRDDEIYLRPNIVKGGYSNWEHYFDVQYRLLREDFVRPLRHGIQHCCVSGIEKQCSHDVRVYEHVNVLSPVCLFVGIGFEIQFDATRMSQVNWEHSRHLIYGSLLCLSLDNFQGSIMFATVVKRDPGLLKEGRLIVKFEGGVSVFDLSPNDVYTMVESTAYFEAYKHNLNKLKELSFQSDEIPFKSYFIGCKFNDIPAPSYSSIHDEFDLSDMLGVRSKVVLHNGSSWPPAWSTNLDPSQLEALKMALTKEVSVIQGPPGTGKTFIGLKIVEAFLKNRSTWDYSKEAPILVVCYTNHALDQFLEGIQALSINEQTPNIIRIGGRCKSEKLSRYVLRKKVNECLAGRNLSRALHGKLSESRRTMFKIKGLISRQLPTASECLGHLSELESIMSPNHYQQLCAENGRGSEGREVEIWLELFGPADGQHYQESGMVPDFSETATSTKVDGDPDGCIEVDNEAQLIEDDRIFEGEEIEFLGLIDDSTLGKRKPEAVRTNEAKRRKLDYERSDFKLFPERSTDKKRVVEVRNSKIISEGLKNHPMSHHEVQQVSNIWKLSSKKRWQLHNYWMKEYVKLCYTEYEEACERQDECLKEIDDFVLQKSEVIGITTTGAAKHHHILKKIHPKVVIFEEAAEIFEAHIVTSLAPSVQQLILIGDHKQLRPKPNCYDLEVKHKLSVSLFERLVKNEIPYVTLNVQHRMRPEISRLIHPSIYDDLKDHETVQRYDSIKGVAKDVFFIDHNKPEKPNKDSNVTTHANLFEADYLANLCHYLLKQGYSPREITILTAYRGQLMELKRRMQRRDFEGVRVAAVDDFQGEENEIILLSLVRSNPEGTIGFLGNQNRTCVALSRAKKGLYVIGNLSMLCRKDKTVWPEIIQDLEQRQCIGEALPLYCRVHQKKRVFAAVPEDFHRCPEGGCDELCNTRLPCGHCCPRICHPDDCNHERYRCLKDCPETLPCGHRCVRRCYECFTGCKPCSTMVAKVLPVCNHTANMPCSADPVEFLCLELCGKPLKCSHTCQNKCSEPCNLVKCNIKVEKTLQCGHKVSEPCHIPSRKISCGKKCTSVLECEHPCTGTCGSCHMGRLHVGCHQDCSRQLVCGHTCGFPCASVCPPCNKPCNNFCVHSRCPKKCYALCVPCTEPCQWQCKHYRCNQPCGEFCDRPRCDMPCEKLLKCGHHCIGLCGEKCPNLCRVCDRDQVVECFFGTEDEEDARFVQLEDCDHFFEATGLDRWIDEATDTEVKFATCPRCRTPVRKSLRYGNRIKQTLIDVAEVKRKQFLPKEDIVPRFKSFSETSKSSDYFKDEVQLISSLLKKADLHPSALNAISLRIAIFERVLKVKEISEGITRSVASRLRSQFVVCDINLISDSLAALKSFLMQDFLSAQQISEASSEIRRVSCMARFCDLLCKLDQKRISPEDKDKIDKAVQQIHTSGRWEKEKMTEEDETALYDLIQELSKKYDVLGLSCEERLMVVKAVDLKGGHWFKCENGHMYCIGECGGAMEKSKCPECGATIGGQQHRLTEGNVHAPEMDGSSYPAWSEQANMANYEF